MSKEWTPKLKGAIYCSPACGGDCKKKDYDDAVQSSRKLARRLGEGWEPVWENLGWHYKVKHGLVEIYPSSYLPDKFDAYFQGTKQFHVSYLPSPEEALGALERVTKQLKKELNQSFPKTKV